MSHLRPPCWNAATGLTGKPGRALESTAQQRGAGGEVERTICCARQVCRLSRAAKAWFVAPGQISLLFPRARPHDPSSRDRKPCRLCAGPLCLFQRGCPRLGYDEAAPPFVYSVLRSLCKPAVQ